MLYALCLKTKRTLSGSGLHSLFRSYKYIIAQAFSFVKLLCYNYLMNLVLRPSVGTEAFRLAEVLQQANVRKQAHGDMVWGGYPFTYDEVGGLIEEGGMFTAVVDNAIAGCVKLTETDERIWGEEGLDGKALYVHRLATADEFKGQRLGGRIIDLAGKHAESLGRELLRLDCPSKNELLCGYYLDEGLSLVRSIKLAGRGGFNFYRPSLFQRPTTV